jgi:hypothetical protein
MTARATFKQADYTRIFNAAKKAGVRVKVGPDGSVEMLTESGVEQHGKRNPWDEVFDAPPA